MAGMLTNRQSWRRQSINGIRRSGHDFLYKECLDNRGLVLTRSQSDSSYVKPDAAATFGKIHATTGSLIEPTQPLLQPASKKKVRWNASVRVILIPTVTEYRQVGIADDLWWRDDNYADFKQNALSELKIYMLKNPSADSKAAIKALYQPSVDSISEIDDGAVRRDKFTSTAVGKSKTALSVSHNNCEPMSDSSTITPFKLKLIDDRMLGNTQIVEPSTIPALPSEIEIDIQDAGLLIKSKSKPMVTQSSASHSTAGQSIFQRPTVSAGAPSAVPKRGDDVSITASESSSTGGGTLNRVIIAMAPLSITGVDESSGSAGNSSSSSSNASLAVIPTATIPPTTDNVYRIHPLATICT